MLNERDMQELSNLISKLTVLGYDVSEMQKIFNSERANINAQLIEDLTDYFPITKNIGVKVDIGNYGFQNLKLNAVVTLERSIGVFDKNSKPEFFDEIIKNTISSCVSNIKDVYLKEVAKLAVEEPVTTIITATAANPIGITMGTNTLYTEVGSINTAKVWLVSSIEDASGTSLDGSGSTITATSANPIVLKLTDSETTITFNASSGTFDGSTVVGTTVSLSGGE